MCHKPSPFRSPADLFLYLEFVDSVTRNAILDHRRSIVCQVLAIGPNSASCSTAKDAPPPSRLRNSSGPGGDDPTQPLKLDNNGDMGALTAQGGFRPLSMGCSGCSLGHIVGAHTGSSVVYMRDHAGDNAVTATDSSGAVVSTVATILVNKGFRIEPKLQPVGRACRARRGRLGEPSLPERRIRSIMDRLVRRTRVIGNQPCEQSPC